MVQAPTPELARQIADEMKKYGKSVKVGHSFGGEGMRSQEYVLKSALVVVGTRDGADIGLVGFYLESDFIRSDPIRLNPKKKRSGIRSDPKFQKSL